MAFKTDEIIFLFGAGASSDANIPISTRMIEKVDELIKNDWSQYKTLYHLVKSATQYADGIQGKKNDDFNIERLFNVLNELIKKEEHPLYPFIGSWNIRFNEIIGDKDFEKIKDFQDLILNELKEWVDLKDKRKAAYFKKLQNFRKEYAPFRIFSLNYDLCIEKVFEDNDNFRIERGFNKERKWDSKLISEYEPDNEPDIILYKLHGSIDWQRNEETGEVVYSDGTVKKPNLIFGTTYKLQYVDPFLFLFSEFRYFSLRSKLVIIIGYGFGDEHINGLLSQALKQDKKRKILYLSKNEKEEFIINKLNCHSDQVIIEKLYAKEFLEKELKLQKLESYFPEEKDDIFGE
jgi:SIR2-like protein